MTTNWKGTNAIQAVSGTTLLKRKDFCWVFLDKSVYLMLHVKGAVLCKWAPSATSVSLEVPSLDQVQKYREFGVGLKVFIICCVGFFVNPPPLFFLTALAYQQWFTAESTQQWDWQALRWNMVISTEACSHVGRLTLRSNCWSTHDNMQGLCRDHGWQCIHTSHNWSWSVFSLLIKLFISGLISYLVQNTW